MERQHLARPCRRSAAVVCRRSSTRSLPGASSRGPGSTSYCVWWLGRPSPMRPACATNDALRVALEHAIRLGRVGRVLVLGERHERDHAADGVDFGGVEVGLMVTVWRRRGAGRGRCSRRHARPARRQWRRTAGAGGLRRRHVLARRGDVACPAPGAADLRPRRRRRRVLLLPRAPEEERGREEDRVKNETLDVHHGHCARRARTECEARAFLGNGVEAPGVIRVTAADAAHREPRAAQRAVALDRLHRVVGAARVEAAMAAHHRTQQVLVPAQEEEQQALHRTRASARARPADAPLRARRRPARPCCARASRAAPRRARASAPALRAHGFAQLAANPVAVDGARRDLAADDVADASAGCGSLGHDELEIQAFDAAAVRAAPIRTRRGP